MTNMAATPIYGKNFKNIFFSKTGSSMILKFGMQHSGLKLYKVCISGDPESTSTYLRQDQIWKLWIFCKKIKKVDFAETIAACDLK